MTASTETGAMPTQRMRGVHTQMERLAVALEAVGLVVGLAVEPRPTWPADATDEQKERRQNAVNQLLRQSVDELRAEFGHARWAVYLLTEECTAPDPVRVCA